MTPSRIAQALGAGLFLPALLFITAFNAIVFANLQDLPYSARLALTFGGLFLGSSLVCAVIFALAYRHAKARFAAKALLAAGVLAMTYDIVSPQTLAMSSFALVLALESIVLAAVIFAVSLISLRSLLAVFSLVGPLITVSGAYEHYARLDVSRQGALSQIQSRAPTRVYPIGAIEELRPEFVWPTIAGVAEYKFALYDETARQYVEQGTSESASYLISAELDPTHSYRWKFAGIGDPSGRDYRGWLYFDLSQLARSRRGAVAANDLRVPGNVYHLVFDGYQSEAFEYLLEQKPRIGGPFTHYFNFHTSSGRTWSSVPELLWGRYYGPEETIDDWRDNPYQSGLFERLFLAGVDIHVYPHYLYYCYEFATTCKPNISLKAEVLGRPPGEKTVVDLWFLKLLPATAKRLLMDDSEDLARGGVAADTWDYGFSINDFFFGKSTLPDESANPYFSVRQFREFVADEDLRPSDGQYTYLHAILPHDPIVVDTACNYVGAVAVELEGFIDQATCAQQLIGELVTKLQSLGRLDDSLIIVQADHGFFWHPSQMGDLLAFSPVNTTDVAKIRVDEADSSTWPSEIIEVRSAALLLVKHPQQREFRTAEDEVQMIDIGPTALDFFGALAHGLPGVPISQIGNQEREHIYFAHNKIPSVGAPTVMSRYRRVDGRWIFDQDIPTRRR